MPEFSAPTVPRRAGRLLRAAGVFAGWTAFGLLLSEQTQLLLSVRGQTRPLWSVVAPSLAGAWMWALFTPVVVAVTRRLRARRLRAESRGWWGAWARCLVGHAALAAALTAVDCVVFTYLRPLIDGVVVAWQAVLTYALLVDAAAYVAVATISEALAAAALARARGEEAAALARTAADLEAQLREARLRALDAQLRPHFLYNTLNAAAELVHRDPDGADEILTGLGFLLRRAAREPQAFIPLGEEIDFVSAYAAVLVRRYGERVRFRVDVPPVLRAAPVPTFVLQPLVENAFRHGVERREGAVAVEVCAAARDGALEVRVRDAGAADGAACDPGVADAERGVGLGNTRARLATLYGDRAGVTLDRTGGATTATLRLPAAEVLA